MNRFHIVFVIILGLVLVSLPSSFAEQKDVNIPSGTGTPGCETENRCFIPHDMEVIVGDQVRWKNNDVAAHTVTSGSSSAGPDKKFDSGLISPGAEFSYTFDKTGAFPYFCMVHPWMEGIVISTVTIDKKPVIDEKFPIKETLVSADGEVYVNIQTTKPRASQVQIIEVRFTDSKQNLLVHMNYDISVIQSGFELFAEKNHHTDDGTEEHAVKAQTDKPIDVKISLRGIYPEGEKPRPVSQTLVFEKVPEFGFISIVVLGAALSSVAIFASRIKILKI